MGPPLPRQADAGEKLAALIARIEQAEADVRSGKAVDMRVLDSESLALNRLIKGTRGAKESLQAPLAQAIRAIERLTGALEDRIAELKAKT